MMATKTIKINPELFNVGFQKKQQSKNKSVKMNPQNKDIISKSFRENILKRIQKLKSLNSKKTNFQYKPDRNNNTPTIQLESTPPQPKEEINEFVEALHHIENNNNNNNNKQEEKKSVVNEDVPFGVLKNGTKPTYRQYYNKTIKNTSPSPLSETNTENTKTMETNTKTMETENDCDQQQKIITENDDNKKSNKYITTVRRQHKLGKLKNRRTVSILLKNKNTQKQVLDAQKELKKTPIKEVKNYLYQQNLIKIGSSIPNDVSRKMYEDCKLTGCVTNTNSDVIIHNLQNWNESFD
jgi:hypothetical protein